MGFQTQKTYARFVFRYSLFLLFLSTFFLFAIINVEVIKTNTSFWLFFFKIFASIMAFFFAKKAFNIGEILFFLFSNDIDTYYKKILATTLFLSTMAPKTSLIVLIFFISLMNRKLLFSTKYISKKNVNKLIFLKVFFLFFNWSITLKALSIYHSYTR